jgi:hypothetical protein
MNWLNCPHHLPPPCNSLPDLLKAIARGFIVLFHVCIWSPSTIVPHFHLLLSSSSFPQVPILQSCCFLLIPNSVFSGVSVHNPAVSILFFGQLKNLISSSKHSYFGGATNISITVGSSLIGLICFKFANPINSVSVKDS